MTASTFWIADQRFDTREQALDALGDRDGLLTEVAGASAMTISVHTETCDLCGARYRVEGVMGALRIMSEGRPCGCGGAS
jgi:hypothetical protein